MNEQSKMQLVFGSALLVITIVLGIWLGRAGKPYSTAIFTVHKLAALATAVLISVFIYHLLGNASATSLVIALIIVGVLCILALFITGALMSTDNAAYSLLKTIHIIATFFAVAAGGGTVLLLSKMR